MKAALFIGLFVLLLFAAPAQTFALGLAEYGQEAAKADQPVLHLPRLNTLAAYLGSWQPERAAHAFREVLPLLCRLFQLLTGALLTGCWLGRRRGFRKYFVKARRAVQHLRPGVHAGTC
ncbi:MAG TPA: hypothetical protein VF646_09035 [Cytophagales bacterium]